MAAHGEGIHLITLLGKDIGFWAAFIAGLFILLHIPSCNRHWAARLKPFSTFLRRYHDLTLVLATILALVHVALSIVGFVFGVWV